MESNSEERNELLLQVRNAAKEGAKEGSKELGRRGGGFLSSVLASIIPIIVMVIAILIVLFMINNKIDTIKDQIGFEGSAEEHDLVLEDDGFLGYTVVDFADAILGEKAKLCKLQVLEQEVSDATTIKDVGLGKLKIFTKTQVITYHGKAIYTVDLSKLSKTDIELDDNKRIITVYIPRPELEPINIQSKDIEFSDVSKGLLAFGDIDITPEQMAQVQTAAQEKMQQKVEQLDIIENANRFAKMVVWEMFQPIINSVEKGYSLEIEFR